MKILLATGIYPPEHGGPATYTHELAQALLQRGHEVKVVTYGDVGEQRDFVTRVARGGVVLARYVRYAWIVYQQAKDVDVIFVQGAVSEGLPTTLAAWVLGRKVVMRVPGDYAWEMGMQQRAHKVESSLDEFLQRKHGGIIRIYEWMERFAARRAWSVIAPSQYMRSVVRRWGVPAERIEVIKNAVQPLGDTRGRERLRRQFAVDDRVVCLTAVRCVPWKGVADLIRWWHRLPPTHMLVVAGDGPELDNWKQLAKHEGVYERVRWLGRVNRQTMTEWYDAADVFVLHTGYEGYPHTVPEAVSRDLPCLVSDQGGNPETREEFAAHVTVLAYQDREAWTQALSKIEQRPALAARVMMSWTHDRMVDQVEAVLRVVCCVSRVLLVGYERELFKTESEAFARVSSLATDRMRLSALVLSQVPEDVSLERDGLHVEAFGGVSWRRMWCALCRGIVEARWLPGRTVISAQDPFAAGLVAYIISRWSNQPLEIQEHADFWSGEWVKEHWSQRVLSVLGLWLLRRAERVRVVSERVKQHLVARGITTAKIEVIPVAQSLVYDLRSTIYDHGPFTFVAPCRFVWQKGLDVLLEAFAILHAQEPRARLRLVGSGPLEVCLRQEIERRGWSKVVEMRGWMERDDLWKDVDGFVMCSRYEGWGRTVVEAMAAGVPVVTTDVGCVGSFVRLNIDALVVPVGDAGALAEAMRQTMTDPAASEARRQAAYERAQSLPTRETLHEAQRVGWSRVLTDMLSKKIGPRFELWIAALLLFVVATRILSAVLFRAQLRYPEWGFLTLVNHWFEGYGYSFAREQGCASAYRSPGYLFFLTALYSLFSPGNTWAQALVQNAFVVAALWLTYAVGKRLVGPRAALVGAFIMAAYPYTFYHYTQFYHTFLQSFFLLFVLWCVLRLEEIRRWSYAIFSGLAIGALAYVQGTILPAAPLISLWLLWRLWPDWRRALGFVALMAVFAATLLAPWTYRNWRVFGEFVPLTTDLGHALFKANNENIYEITKRGYPQEIIEDVTSSTNPLFKQYRLPVPLEEELRQAGVLRESILWTEWHPREPSLARTCREQGINEYVFNQYWLAKTKTFWKDHGGLEVWRLPLQKISTFWRPGLFPTVKTGAPWSFAGVAWKEWAARTAVAISTAIVILLGWIGVIVHLRRKDRYVWLPLILFVVFTSLHALVAGYTKYRIPIDHVLAAYAGWTIIAIWDWARGRQNV